MRNNLGEQLTVDDMARAANFSKFHFTRLFQRVTGVSPGRFLSALRLEEAKRLLASTSLNVADISVRVGYNSVGTFSTRFAKSVGLSPTIYRRFGGPTQNVGHFPSAAGEPPGGVVSGYVRTPPRSERGFVFVGLFPSLQPEGQPVRCTMLDGSGPFVLDQVPAGTWFLLSRAVRQLTDQVISQPFTTDQVVSLASLGPIEVRQNRVARTADLRLRSTMDDRPAPALRSVPDVGGATPSPPTNAGPYRRFGRRSSVA
ncbi:MAG TPA: AraC family transcriptional regulator [Micromonosporaceae bacterium]